MSNSAFSDCPKMSVTFSAYFISVPTRSTLTGRFTGVTEEVVVGDFYVFDDQFGWLAFVPYDAKVQALQRRRSETRKLVMELSRRSARLVGAK